VRGLTLEVCTPIVQVYLLYIRSEKYRHGQLRLANSSGVVIATVRYYYDSAGFLFYTTPERGLEVFRYFLRAPQKRPKLFKVFDYFFFKVKIPIILRLFKAIIPIIYPKA